MRRSPPIVRRYGVLALITAALQMTPCVVAQDMTFRGAPSSATQMKNPYRGSAAAAEAGKKLYGQNCSQCHGNNLQGMGPAPALDTPSVRKAAPGEVFWFITTGKLAAGMPSWSALPKLQRWQIVAFIQAQGNKTAK